MQDQADSGPAGGLGPWFIIAEAEVGDDFSDAIDETEALTRVLEAGGGILSGDLVAVIRAIAGLEGGLVADYENKFTRSERGKV